MIHKKAKIAIGIGLFYLLAVFSFNKLHAQSVDIFIMPGSDFVRPGLKPRVNLNIGAGLSIQKLNKIKVGNELTFSYTYENNGSHGFWHTEQGAHTEALGLMKNVATSKLPNWSGYTWTQIGITNYTGFKGVQNRLYESNSIGVIYHFTPHNGIWVQEQYNKIATVPWYTTTSIGYCLSF